MEILSTTESNIKIVLIVNGFQKDYVLNIVNGLCTYCKVILICSDNFAQHDFNSNVSVENLRGNQDFNVPLKVKFIRILKYYIRLVLYIVRTDVKILHILWIRFSLIDGIFFSLLARFMGKKVVYTAHDILPHDRNTRLNKLIFGLIYKSQNCIIVHTEYMKQRLIDEFNVKCNKIQFIEHGVYDVQCSEHLTTEVARDLNKLNKDDFVLLFFGRIAKYKGVEQIASNINKFKHKKRNVKLIIAGEIANNYKDEFCRYIRSIDTSNIITKFGFIDNDEVEMLFKLSNVTILPYKETSQSGVLFLSYAFGTPIIAPKIGGFPNYIIHGKTGLLYNPNSASDFINTINEAISVFNDSNGKYRYEIIDYVNANFSWSQSAKKLFHLYAKYL